MYYFKYFIKVYGSFNTYQLRNSGMPRFFFYGGGLSHWYPIRNSLVDCPPSEQSKLTKNDEKMYWNGKLI